MKKLALITTVCLAGSSAWALNAWWYGNVDRDFNNPDNYSVAGFIPMETNGVNFTLSVTDVANRQPILFEAGGNYEASTMWSYAGNSGGSRNGLVEMEGGFLRLHGGFTIGYDSTNTALHHVTNTWDMTGGVVTGGTVLTVGRMLNTSANYVSSEGRLILSGENTAMYFSEWLYIGWTNGTNDGHRAYVDISDGAVLQTSLNAVQNLTIRDGSQVNLSGGYISLFGNRTNAVMDNVEAGKITAFGFEYGSPQWDQGYQVLVTYDSGTDYTTVSAIPEPGTLTLLGLLGGGLLLFRKRRRL